MRLSIFASILSAVIAITGSFNTMIAISLENSAGSG